jgi:hypothetical protein
MIDRDEAIRLPVRERTQQHRVDDAEDRGVRADSEREGEDDDRGEGRALGETAEAVTDVAEEGVHRGWRVAGGEMAYRV